MVKILRTNEGADGHLEMDPRSFLMAELYSMVLRNLSIFLVLLIC